MPDGYYINGSPAWLMPLLDAPLFIGLCDYGTGNEGLMDLGGGSFDPADYAVTGRTTSLTLELIGDTSGGTCTVTLWDLVAEAVVASVTITENAPTPKSVSVPTPGAATRYELWAQLTAGAAPLYWTVRGAVLRVTRR